MRKKEILPFVITYMDLEQMMLSEIGQGERHILHGNYLHMESGRKNKKQPQNQISRKTRGWGYTRKIGRGQSIQNCSYNMNKV